MPREQRQKSWNWKTKHFRTCIFSGMWALWLVLWPRVCSVYQYIRVLTLRMHTVFVRGTHYICGKRPVCTQVDTIHRHTQAHKLRESTWREKLLSYSNNRENTPIHCSPAWRGLKWLLAFLKAQPTLHFNLIALFTQTVWACAHSARLMSSSCCRC